MTWKKTHVRGRKSIGRKEEEGERGFLFFLGFLPSSFWSLLAFRFLNGALVQTFFNPDEYWQSLEVAHDIAFGYGQRTWEWEKGLRGYTHPLLFAFIYKTLSLIRCDSPFLLRVVPKMVQSAFAALGDLYLFRLSSLVFSSDRTGWWALASSLVNWFTFFCITRTFSNSLETSLSLVALFYWFSFSFSLKKVPKVPKEGPKTGIRPSTEKVNWVRIFFGEPMRERQLALWIAGLTCVIRPTSAILWIYMGICELLFGKDRWRFLGREVFPVGFSCLLVSTLVDRIMSGRWISVPLNFLSFNVGQSGASIYGTHPHHWYFSQGFPAMLGTFLPLVGLGIWWAPPETRQLAGLILWTIGLYSCLGHKEFRFVLPVLPLALAYSGYALTILERHLAKRQKHVSTETEDKTKKERRTGGWSKTFKRLLAFLAVTQMGPALYFSLIHQRGAVSVMSGLETEAVRRRLGEALFLMPCHSTPLYSHLHCNVTLSILDCSPSWEKGHVTESDKFLRSPENFTRDRFRSVVHNGGVLPTHLVMFNVEEQKLQLLLKDYHYEKVKSSFRINAQKYKPKV